MGNSVVLCTVVGQKEAKDGVDFLPLTVHYQERYYADGRIPGGYNKRESKPSTRETLISRLIDRPIRPLFPEGYYAETQIICTVLAYDASVDSDILALIGASAALEISGVPVNEVVAAAKVGYHNGEFILNPNSDQIASGKLDLIVAGTESSVLMVESEAKQLSEEEMLEAVMFGHREFQPVINLIREFSAEVGVEKWSVELKDNSELKARIKDTAAAKLNAAYSIHGKKERHEALALARTEIKQAFADNEQFSEQLISSLIKELEKDVVRNNILTSNTRIDGRSNNQVRPIECEVDLLPVVHGSALFTRGETQVLSVVTLGVGQDEQSHDDLAGERKEHFMLHYNFPPYSVGESSALRAPGRREIGHGKLACRALTPIMPGKVDFPYTVRVVAEVTESNGSSSMATVCSSSMAMMATGVPLAAPVAGIAMGLIKEDEKFAVLSDIMGDEDHLGDMDFKVAGTGNGITALQMDIKINGIGKDIMQQALAQAKDGRMHILAKMEEVISESRAELSANAPKTVVINIDKSKIRELIGPGGKMIKEITEASKAKIDIDDSGKEGRVLIAAPSDEALEIALRMVNNVVAVAELNAVYDGRVTRVADFGAFVNIFGNTEGLVHVSEIAEGGVKNVADVLAVGDLIKVKVIAIGADGKIKLSMRAVSQDSGELVEGYVASQPPSSDRGSKGGRGTSNGSSNRWRERDSNNEKGDRSKRQESNKDFKEDKKSEDKSEKLSPTKSKKRRFF
jgi:polyribonucleotide nucleotidyltransferase